MYWLRGICSHSESTFTWASSELMDFDLIHCLLETLVQYEQHWSSYSHFHRPSCWEKPKGLSGLCKPCNQNQRVRHKQLGYPKKYPFPRISCEMCQEELWKTLKLAKKKKKNLPPVLSSVTFWLIWPFAVWTASGDHKMLKTGNNANDVLSIQMQINCVLGKSNWLLVLSIELFAFISKFISAIPDYSFSKFTFEPILTSYWCPHSLMS